MKYTLLLQIIFVGVLSAQKDSVYIKKSVDDMTDKVYYLASRLFVVADMETKKAFKIDVVLNNEMKPSGIIGSFVNIDKCRENDELIFMFQDSSKIKLTSWNEFNCEGTAYFKLTSTDWGKLAEMKVIKAMMRNGRSYASLSKPVPKEDQDYFQQLFYAIDHKKIKLSK